MSFDSSVGEGSEVSFYGQCFKFLTFIDVGKERVGKLDCHTMQQWIKHAKLPDITEEDVKKYFRKDGRLDINEYKECVEKLAKEKKRDKEDIAEDLERLYLTNENQTPHTTYDLVAESMAEEFLDSRANSLANGQIPDHTFYIDPLQTSFKMFTIYNKEDEKLDCNSMQKWIKNAKIPDITEDDVKKHFGKDGGLDSNEFKERVERLAMEKKRDIKKIVHELEVLKKLEYVEVSKKLEYLAI